MKKIELLAPAGNMESLKAAVAAGCDAVYLGLTSFSARAFAGNFNEEELVEAVQYCHLRDVCVYVTMNTMLYETEIENAIKMVDFLYHHDVDALLIQDLGLFHLVKQCYPDFDVHCSTQMHIHNLAGVSFMKSQGVSRVVLARETPIDIIKEACKLGVEIEIFAYGAICISYSGQCLMSASMKNRSANRGMCAQCCRLKYYPEQGGYFAEGDYILSPKDLNVINQIPDLISAGVASLKIEGRMKRPEYVYIVVKTFREAIDAYYDNQSYQVSKQRDKALKLMFNRGFSKGHIFSDKTSDRMSQYRPNHQGVVIGEVIQAGNNWVNVRLFDKLTQNDGLRILNEKEDIGLTAVKILKDSRLVSHANKGDIVQLTYKAKQHPRKGDLLHKTSDRALIEEIDNQLSQAYKKTNVEITYEANVGQPLMITVSDGERSVTSVSEYILEIAKTAPITKERVENAILRIGELPYQVTSIHGNIGNVFIPVSIINDTRRNAFDLLNNERYIRHHRTQKQEYSFTLNEPTDTLPRLIVEDRGSSDHNDYVTVVQPNNGITPVVQEGLSTYQTLSHCVISQIGDLYSDKQNCIAGMTMNIANSYALAYILSQPGISGVVFSSECNDLQIRMALEAFTNRYGFTPKTYRFVYGRRTLMTIKDNFIGNPVKSISDLHGNKYPVMNQKNTVEIIEPEVYHQSNLLCYGSYLITDKHTEHVRNIEEEAYEEISRRI